jgi:hypothetical protein
MVSWSKQLTRRDEACSNLASLKFSQSNRSADPKDPSRIITTTTTTTFSMTREMAKSICAHFLEAHVIENAIDLQNTSFKDRGIYMLTPKGLHILERFIAKNGIGAEHLMPIFGTQPICMKMLHLERRSGDDEIMINKGVMDVLFRRFTGAQPNATAMGDDDLQNDYYRRWYNKTNSATGQGAGGEAELDRSSGMPVHKVYNAEYKRDEYHFAAIPACLWLIDFTTCVGLDEASDVAAHFVRYGLITLVSDKGKVKDGNLIANVKAGGAGGGAGAVMVSRLLPSNPLALIPRAGMKADSSARSRIPRDRQGHLQNYQRGHDFGPLDRRERQCHQHYHRQQLQSQSGRRQQQAWLAPVPPPSA